MYQELLYLFHDGMSFLLSLRFNFVMRLHMFSFLDSIKKSKMISVALAYKFVLGKFSSMNIFFFKQYQDI